MISLRHSKDRGFFDHGWLKTHHTFSFSDYYDLKYMGFGPLRVINEDFIEGGAGFPTHGHKNMEIITYIVDGALEHKDSTGSNGTIKPGEVQKMSAGRGIRHSEFNHLKDKPTHLYQIWMLPNEENIDPEYQQIDFSEKLNGDEPVLLASPTGENSTISLHQNLFLWGRRFKNSGKWTLGIASENLVWIQVVKGNVTLKNGRNQEEHALSQGDGASLQNETQLEISAQKGSEVLVFIAK